MEATQRDYYQVLGVERDADETAIKNAYHKLAMKWHPDRNKSPEAADRFKEIATAYAILKDPKKRSRYDSMGMEGVSHFTHEDLFGGLDLGNLFGDMGFGFGGGSIFDRMFGGTRRAQQRNQGENLHINIEVPLDLIHRGGKHEFTVSHPTSCSTCNGYGTADGNAPPLCEACKGSGRRVEARQENREGQHIQFQQVKICPVCHGKGVEISQACKTCSGYGKVEKQETLKITIPAGIEEGTVMKVAGHGLPGNSPQQSPGDLEVSIHSCSDLRFQRRGADLWRPETVEAIDAMLGTEITVPTLGRDIKVKIPPGTQPDDVLRIKGKGLSRYRADGSGDLNLRIIVHIPEQLEKTDREALEAIRQRSIHQP
jgi:molecular chaperone DnaJ